VTTERVLEALGLDTGSARRLVELADLLRDVAAERGFIAPGDAERILERHVLDALRAAPFLPTRRTVGDVGTGAGIPGLPLAVVLSGVRFDLIEPRQARVAFLESAIDHLGLSNARVIHGRVEGVADGSYGTALARAFAPLERAWGAIRPKLRPEGRLVFFAGERAAMPSSLPGAASIERHVPGQGVATVLARSGPLIIITAQ
jgi:16S rRNA (guanine527-N7)-methyltransferase